MVVGNGFIAQAFSQYAKDKDVLIFASGVAYSKSCTEADCNREEELIRKTLSDCDSQNLFVYFSSCSIANFSMTNDVYHMHKKKMEGIVQAHPNRTIIFRLSNVVGENSNASTLFDYLVNKIRDQEMFDLWRGAKRNIIDIDDVVNICNYIIKNDLFKNKVINVANLETNTVDEIVDEISKYLGVMAKYSIIKCDDDYDIDTMEIETIIDNLSLSFGCNYLKNVVAKYH